MRDDMLKICSTRILQNKTTTQETSKQTHRIDTEHTELLTFKIQVAEKKHIVFINIDLKRK